MGLFGAHLNVPRNYLHKEIQMLEVGPGKRPINVLHVGKVSRFRRSYVRPVQIANLSFESNKPLRTARTKKRSLRKLFFAEVYTQRAAKKVPSRTFALKLNRGRVNMLNDRRREVFDLLGNKRFLKYRVLKN